MTRPKVPADKRIRTAQACETCKRRKQKCNGLHPCNTCTKRSLDCEYRGNSNGNVRDSFDPTDVPATKRRLLDSEMLGQSQTMPQLHPSPPGRHPTVTFSSNLKIASAADRNRKYVKQEPYVETDEALDLTEQDLEPYSRNSTVSGLEEETQLHQSTRMLADPTGRLLYVGDSASLAYLQLIRVIVQARLAPGDHEFVNDPDRHKILEAPTEVLLPFKPHILPDRPTARVLIDAFFAQTSGLIEVLDRPAFEQAVDACYSQPIQAHSSHLCILYLVLAIGTVLGNPRPGTHEEAMFARVRSQDNSEEYFFRTAKVLGDPVTGFEDADFWSVQALSLMAVYMLAVSKRNAAYAYFGMAVRSAFALGLHRVHENHAIFSNDGVRLRRNLWRSLFVLDKFLSASLGRPAAIAEEECSADALLVLEKRGEGVDGVLVAVPDASSGLDAAVRSCQIIGLILKKIYARRRITVRLAAEIADHCKVWSNSFQASLDTLRLPSYEADTASLTAALHVNLLYAHSVILLTRPFFICLLMTVHNERSGHKLRQTRWHSKMSKYCDACFAASNHTISLVELAYRRQILPRRNPFVIYFLFAACLILLSNEFGSVFENPTYAESIETSVKIMEYCAQTDKQAQRLCYIINAFRKAVSTVREESGGGPAAHATPGQGLTDPMATLFSTARSASLNQAVNRPVAPRPSFGSASGSNMTMPPGSGTSPTSSSAAISSTGFDASDSVGDGEVDFESFFETMNATPAEHVGVPETNGHPLAHQNPPMVPLRQKLGAHVQYPYPIFVPNGPGGHPGMASVPFFAPGEYSRGE